MRECSAVLRAVFFMQRLPFVSVLLSVLLLSGAQGQVQPSASGATGVVSGHVYCADTNGPARFASVALEPVSDVINAAAQAGRSRPQTTETAKPPVLTTVDNTQTGLDGGFTVSNLKPGVYYVNADLPGYLSTVSGLTGQDWAHPTAEVADRMAKGLQRVTVEAGRTAFVTVTLERGASVSGMVSFSDGTPALGVRVSILREKSDGSWETLQVSQPLGFGIATNDVGQYRIAGLSAGRYVIEVDLAISQSQTTGSIGATSSSFSNSSSSGGYRLSIFSGGKLKANKDAAFALTAGESRPGEDLVIPRLHSVSGVVVAARDGRPLVGSVELLDGKNQFTSSNASQPDGEFHFEGVPEGNFVLMIYAMDPQALAANADAIAKNPGSARVYGTVQQALDVSADIDGLVISVPQVDMPVSALDRAAKQH